MTLPREETEANPPCNVPLRGTATSMFATIGSSMFATIGSRCSNDSCKVPGVA